jgi:hypothetical protein
VFVPHASERYTTSRILTAEEELVEAATTRAPGVDALVADAALAVHESTTGVHLDAGQRQLVEYFTTLPRPPRSRHRARRRRQDHRYARPRQGLRY